MGSTYRFLATPDEVSAVLEWFRALPERPTESCREAGRIFFFAGFGPLHTDVRKSPVASVFLPVRRNNVLTTIGEVHFLATPQSQFAGLKKINKQFRSWIEANPCVFSIARILSTGGIILLREGHVPISD
jgi:hypothetical protein